MKSRNRTMCAIMRSTLCRLFLAMVVMITAGCASQTIPISADEDRLEPDRGYLLIGFDTNRPIYRLVIDGAERFFVHRSDLPYGNYYLLVDLPAGEYYLERVDINAHQYYQLEREDWTFRVVPGQVNYAGDVVMRSTGWRYPRAIIQMANRSSFGLKFLEESYPNILASRDVAFTGIGEDGFFEFARTLGAKMEEIK